MLKIARVILFITILSACSLSVLWAQSLDYRYEALGVSFSAPKNWYSMQMLPSQQRETINKGLLGVFTQKPFSADRIPILPVITITAIISDARRSSLEVAGFEVKKKTGAGFKIIKEPQAEFINGREAAYFTYEKTFRDHKQTGKVYTRVRQRAYFFIKDRYVFQLNFADSPQDFGRNIRAFDFCVSTFKVR